MKLLKIPAKIAVSLTIAGLIVIFALFPDTFFPLLSLERDKVAQGEAWRLLTSNFVHFGWPHTLINLAAFGIFLFILIDVFAPLRFITLLIFCSLVVGTGIYYLNPEYKVYAGLSGVMHGLFIAGFIVNKHHARWKNALMIGALFGKILLEQQPDYHATHLQNFLPVAVAYDAHLYGALAGLAFALGDALWRKYAVNRKP